MPMRFQSLDLNMGDNYVDKHRDKYLTAKISVIVQASLIKDNVLAIMKAIQLSDMGIRAFLLP